MMLITFLTTILVAQSLSIDNRQQQQQISRSIKASERRAKVRTVNARPTCPRCARPPSVCVCDALPARAIATKTKLLVLQHPNEFRRRHFSTVPLLPLCLESVEIKVGYSFDAATIPAIRDATAPPLLLWPAAGAAPLETVADALGDEARLLVVIDGTWAQAKRIYRQSPSLRALRPVAFDGAATSALEAIRSEPEAHCVSTVEACARALRLLEPTPAVSGAAAHLDASLRLMVDHQLRSVRERPAPRFKR